MKRFPANRLHAAIAMGANLLAPGTGIVLLGRERLGATLAVLFTFTIQAALWGLLLVPAMITRPVAIAAAAAAGVCWAAAQWLLMERLKAVGLDAAAKVGRILSLAGEAMEYGRYADAYHLLREAIIVWDDDVDLLAHWAQLMTLMGRFAEARGGWERVLELDGGGVYRVEAITALERLPGG